MYRVLMTQTKALFFLNYKGKKKKNAGKSNKYELFSIFHYVFYANKDKLTNNIIVATFEFKSAYALN